MTSTAPTDGGWIDEPDELVAARDELDRHREQFGEPEHDQPDPDAPKVAPGSAVDPAENQAVGPTPIDWKTFWTRELPPTDWLVEPILPRGRQVAIYSKPKAGKSLLSLEIAAAAATGRGVLGSAPGDPISTLVLDQENTQDDLHERLIDYGYGPDSDLELLHYYQLQDIAPLDTEKGGLNFLGLVHQHKAQLVIIDTMARVVNGPENDADTYRAFYRNTGVWLKSAGVTVMRLDHAGHDSGHQRGSSEKAGDVDVVFRMSVDGDVVTLTRTHSRVPWVPAEIVLTRENDPLRHKVGADAWPAGTADTAALLDDYEVPLDATATTAAQALMARGQGRRKALVLAALKWRRQRP